MNITVPEPDHKFNTHALIVTRVCGKSKMANWSEEETLKLIQIWSKDSIQAMLEGSKRNKDVYRKISQEMEAAGFSKTSEQCNSKMLRV